MTSRAFAPEDQLAFAELSGDFNPMHMDELTARRTLYGAPVVHGIHMLMWALDRCLEGRSAPAVVGALKAAFTRPVKLGERLDLSIAEADDTRCRMQMRLGSAIAASVEVQWRHPAGAAEPVLPRPGRPDREAPRDPALAEIPGLSEQLPLHLDHALAAERFPHLVRCVAPIQIAALLATTRLVGARCPGLHSIFSELTLEATAAHATAVLAYEAIAVDKRIGLVQMAIGAPGLQGRIKSFRRPSPLQQPGFGELKGRVNPEEFAGQRALIVGGSRGLGEVAAKLLCAGGADVKITYSRGRDDARRIVQDIVSNGGAAAELHLDVLCPQIPPEQISHSVWAPTHLYYFATPFIFSGVRGVFSPELFARFCEFYVGGFVSTLGALGDLDIQGIFYPSTVALDELPADMGEYTAAKAAGECLCAFLEKTRPGLCVYRPRLPRAATDQTASILPVANRDPVALMIDELRRFRDLGCAGTGA